MWISSCPSNIYRENYPFSLNNFSTLVENQLAKDEWAYLWILSYIPLVNMSYLG